MVDMDLSAFSSFESSSRFPKRGVLPKAETGALSFISENNDFDGRGVIVGILDTGCDPGAQGLRFTSEGKPKFIDVIDSTGSGDCNTSKQIKISSLSHNNCVLTSPLTNNKLLLNKQWISENKNNYFNIGLIRAYDFFPKPLIKRIEKKRTEKFGNKLRKSVQTLENKINIARKKLKNASKDKTNGDKKILKEEIEDLITLTDLLSKETNSGSGPVFDVVVWNDGEKYNAVLNTICMDSYVNCTHLDETLMSENKHDDDSDDEDKSIVFVKKDANGENIFDLSQLDVLTNYKNCHRYSTISQETLLNYVLNIYDSGNLVSIVVPGGSHGTHVAGIVGGYYANDSSLNGIAPGVQFVSIKIGDTRLSTMETNQGLMRALYHIKENKCDIVNMSYGEPSTAVKTGCFPKGVETLVWKYGIIFISSAGNDGPCLSTAGAPQSISDSIIGIGAMFSPQMIESEYGLVQKGDDGQNVANYYQAYSWSSRGPSMDGAIGVKIMCPGGAISTIPNYTLSKNQLMNGTSMSSPNACGNVALLLSALKQENVGYTPYGIELALINSANDSLLHKIDPCARGYGLLQINEAYEYCTKNMQVINSPITHYEININGRNHSNCRGIYIREPLQCTTSYNVAITPKFHEKCENSFKVKYSMKCMLKADAGWIKPAPFTLIAGNGRYFEIMVDPIKMYQMNSHRYIPVFRGYVVGINNDNISAGPLFRIPVTVCNHITYPLNKRHQISFMDVMDEEKVTNNYNNAYLYRRKERFTVGKLSRVFHQVPTGASAMRINIKCISAKNNKQLRFCFATLYGKQREQVKFERWARFCSGDELSSSLQRVEPNTIIETTLCQYALSFGECVMEWSVEFIGPQIICNNSAINMNIGDEFGLITLRTDGIACKDVLNQINPLVKFDTLVCYYQAKYASINLNTIGEIGDMDIGTEDKIYTLDLEYEFDQKVSSSKNIIKFSLLDDLLYEALYEGTFWMLFDANKQLISSGDAFEESSKISRQKGYVLKLQLRSSSIKLLEKAKTTKLRIDSVLSAKQQICADIYPSKLNILKGSGKITSAITMRQYENKDLFITTPTNATIKALDHRGDIEAGTQLLGYLKLNKDIKECLRAKFRNNGQKSSSLCITIMCTIANISKAAESRTKKITDVQEDKNGKHSGDDEEKLSLEEKQRDAMIDWINKKLKGAEQKKAFESISIQEIFNKYPNYLPILNLKLDIYRDSENIKQVLDICDDILHKVNLNEIAAFFGRKVLDKNDNKYKKNNKKYKEEKASVIDALKAKLNAIKKGLSVIHDDEQKERLSVIHEEKDFILDLVKISKNDLKPFEDIYKQLSEWIDIEKDKKLFNINLWYKLQKGLVGKVLNMINDKMNATTKDDKAASREQIEMKLKMYKKYLGKKEFHFLVEQIQMDLFKKFPKQYRRF